MLYNRSESMLATTTPLRGPRRAARAPTLPTAGEASPKRLAHEGFEEEALPYLDAVYHFALRLRRGDHDAAADLAQDTFLRAYRGWATYRPGTKVLSWLFTICRNAAIRQGEALGYQRERTVTELGLDGDAWNTLANDALPAIDDPEASYFDGLLDNEVIQAIDELPVEFREAVVLSDLHDLSYGEIAEVLGVPGGTVKSRIHRGRLLLQNRLRGYAVEMGYLRAAREA